MSNIVHFQPRDERELLNQIFEENSPWGVMTAEQMHKYSELHPSTLLFYHEERKAYAAMLWRWEPTDDRYVGNFPCNVALLDWLHRTYDSRRAEACYLFTVEDPDRSQEILSVVTVEDVISRLKRAGTEPFISKKSNVKPFFWLDGDLFPARTGRPHRSRFRKLDADPPGLVLLERERGGK